MAFRSWTFGPRRLPLRVHLVILVVGAMLPLLFFTAVLVHWFVAEARGELEQRLRLNSQGLARAMDREFETSIAALEVLGTSQTLDLPDLHAFYDHAALARQRRAWGTVVLVGPDGTQILNLLRPLGTAMPNVSGREYLHESLRTRRPVVSDLYPGSITGSWVVAVTVPVIRDDRVRYVLAAIIYAKDLASVVSSGLPDREWTRALVDRSGLIAARTRAPEQFVGHRATPEFIARTASSTSGVYTTKTIEGVKVLGAFARAPFSGWTAAVAVPAAIAEGAQWRSVALTVFAGAAVLVIGVLVALLVGHHISGDMAQATAAAEALASGRDAGLPASTVTEVSRLGAALEASARLLAERERQRSESLERERNARVLEADARREAEAANRAKDHFLAVLSHELRTPLTPVLAGVSLLQRSERLSQRGQEHLAVIRRNVEVESRLIDDLLDLSRIAHGKLELDRRHVDLGVIVERAMDVCRADIAARGLHFEADLGPRPIFVDADAARLQQVFWNVLKNAVKFTPHGGCVGLRCRRQDDHAVVDVTDSGIGIEPSDLERVFDAFTQAERSMARNFGGLGLGLAISRALVEAHGGTIAAHSEGPDRGSTFTIRLPVVFAALRPAAAGAESRSDPGDHATRSRLRILLVEDHGDTAEMIRVALELEGHGVEIAGDVATALDMAAHADFDVLISDVALPDGTGVDLMQQLRSRGHRLPGIAMSGFGHESDIQRTRAAGFRAHLVKPVDPERLLEIVHQAAGKAGSTPPAI